MNFFDRKDLGNQLLQLCPKVVKHPVYIYIYIYTTHWSEYIIDAVYQLEKQAQIHIKFRYGLILKNPTT